VVPSTPTAAATAQKAIHHMSTEVTDDRAVRRSRKATPPTPDDPTGDEHPGVSRLYTVAMMADVLRVPRSAVRRWRRRGLIEPARRSGSIEWFGFPQLVVGRQLVRLLQAGLSLRDIDAQLPTLAPGGAAEAARIADRIVADGRRLSIRRDGGLMGAGGQLQLGFYTDALSAPVPQDRPTEGDGPGRPTAPSRPPSSASAAAGRTATAISTRSPSCSTSRPTSSPPVRSSRRRKPCGPCCRPRAPRRRSRSCWRNCSTAPAT
jgi:DNA-binding transcriptional MerR regulator